MVENQENNPETDLTPDQELEKLLDTRFEYLQKLKDKNTPLDEVNRINQESPGLAERIKTLQTQLGIDDPTLP